MIMQMVTKERFVNSLLLLLFTLMPLQSKAQWSGEAVDLIAYELADPIKKEIRLFIREADKKKLNCDLTFFRLSLS
ncbi:hypothetical protein SanaruYs_10390 [Chryseotalea sanaruensis]|uniref:Uncharacterized protein n=2 Tax=Chryseotalea sanaruensis TaxID=2482724 RepID=A0A401U7F0_9BACT|nr:hypothetical protein SanaruYs_10390 [Chryseotalea sanaruensis]